MDCKTVRDRFSSLWEKEVLPPEEKVLEEHLSSCPNCRREFEQFEKTMRWLHSAGEVDVPEGFLPDLYKKIEEKKRTLPGGKPGGRGFHFPLSFNLPVQAAAMVAVVFLALYLTQRMPIDGVRPDVAQKTPSSLSVEKKSETVLAQNEAEKEQRALEKRMETPRSKDVEPAEAPVLKERAPEEAPALPLKAESKKAEAPAPSTGAMGVKRVDSYEAAKVKTLSPEPGRIERGSVANEKSAAAPKPPREITLRISDRERVILQLHELLEQFGGDVVAVEGELFLASLPTGSIAEFEKELAGLSSSGKADRSTAKKHAVGGLGFEKGVKKEADGEKDKGQARPAADAANRSIVRIRLMEE